MIGITAAGTVPDFHRIPFNQVATATRLLFSDAKLIINSEPAKRIVIFVSLLFTLILLYIRKILYFCTQMNYTNQWDRPYTLYYLQ